MRTFCETIHEDPLSSDRPAGNDDGRDRPGLLGLSNSCAPGPKLGGERPRAGRDAGPGAASRANMAGGYGVMGDDGSIDYTVHEAWNEATNVYLIVILVSFGLFMYARRNKRKIMRIFSVPPMSETLTEPNFYDTMSKIRLRQQLEMYSILPTWILLNPPKRPMIFFAKTFAISLPFSREFSKSGGCGLQNSSAGCQLFSDETLQTWLRRSSDDRHIIYTQSLSRPVIFSSED